MFFSCRFPFISRFSPSFSHLHIPSPCPPLSRSSTPAGLSPFSIFITFMLLLSLFLSMGSPPPPYSSCSLTTINLLFLYLLSSSLSLNSPLPSPLPFLPSPFLSSFLLCAPLPLHFSFSLASSPPISTVSFPLLSSFCLHSHLQILLPLSLHTIHLLSFSSFTAGLNLVISPPPPQKNPSPPQADSKQNGDAAANAAALANEDCPTIDQVLGDERSPATGGLGSTTSRERYPHDRACFLLSAGEFQRTTDGNVRKGRRAERERRRIEGGGGGAGGGRYLSDSSGLSLDAWS